MANTTPAGARAMLQVLPQRLLAAIRNAERANLADALQVARNWSSGRFTAAMLRAMGHPYRHGGVPPQDPGIINRQSGTFLRSWRTRQPRRSGDSVQSRLFNNAPHASFLATGTSKMIRRPIRDRIISRLRPRRLARIRAAVRAVLSL